MKISGYYRIAAIKLPVKLYCFCRWHFARILLEQGKETHMFKRILCLAVSIAAVFTACMGALCACSVIDNHGSVRSDSTEDVTVGEQSAQTNPDAEPGWSYSFGSEFIDENGIRYVWDNIDEDTRMNLGEVMNAIRNVQIYCPLTVGFPKDETKDFLELVSNCSAFYTYAGGIFKTHSDDNGMVKGLTIMYSVDYEEEAEQRSQSLSAALEKIVSEMPVDGSEFEKIKYLHDYLVLNCRYGEDSTSPFTAYGAIVEHMAACQGYADSLNLLLSRAGFETAFATGEGAQSSIKHKWCYVKLSDGHWYAIDPTWDDTESETEQSDYIGYNYFLISDEMLLRDHAAKYTSRYYNPPVADSMDMNFHKVMGYMAVDEGSAYSVLKKQAIEAAKEGRRYLYLRMEDGEKLSQIYEELAKGPSGDNRMQDIIAAANSAAGTDISTVSWVESLDPKLGTLAITLKYNEN